MDQWVAGFSGVFYGNAENRVTENNLLCLILISQFYPFYAGDHKYLVVIGAYY